MERDDAYDFGEAFARLTCLFEDAGSVATDGQAQGLSQERTLALLTELERLTGQMTAALSDLRKRVLR